MAYDAAMEASVDPALIDIYLSSAILPDPTWYSKQMTPQFACPGPSSWNRCVARFEG